MKISISYPPLESEKGVPLLSQNRQFQWFHNPTYIYPVVPAYAATLLKSRGYEVFWDDGIAEGLTFSAWLDRLKRESPDLVVLETKTPVVKMHWKIIQQIQESVRPEKGVVLMGDHVTSLPEESFENSGVDYVITGGDYDFSLLLLAEWLGSGKGNPPAGIYARKGKKIVTGEGLLLNNDLNTLPFIDRNLTRWDLYAYENGNFKYLPGTYTMAGRDCWWGRCTFCSWTTLYPGTTFRTVSPERHVEEVGRLVTDLKVREIFDDSGCFPKGEWLERYCEGIIKNGYHKKTILGANMRIGALSQEEWHLMKKANFRFILIGLESMNQKTLNRLTKGIQVSQIEETLRMAKKAGLEPHITVMVGYPWETREDAEETVNFARRMFLKGYIDSLQATIVVPYPGTPMFEEAKQNGWLLTEDWDRYDMRESVWKSPVGTADVQEFTQSLYRAAMAPSFVMRKVIHIRSVDDLKFLYRAGMKVLGHLRDFSHRKGK